MSEGDSPPALRRTSFATVGWIRRIRQIGVPSVEAGLGSTQGGRKQLWTRTGRMNTNPTAWRATRRAPGLFLNCHSLQESHARRRHMPSRPFDPGYRSAVLDLFRITHTNARRASFLRPPLEKSHFPWSHQKNEDPVLDCDGCPSSCCPTPRQLLFKSAPFPPNPPHAC